MNVACLNLLILYKINMHPRLCLPPCLVKVHSVLSANMTRLIPDLMFGYGN